MKQASPYSIAYSPSNYEWKNAHNHVAQFHLSSILQAKSAVKSDNKADGFYAEPFQSSKKAGREARLLLAVEDSLLPALLFTVFRPGLRVG